MSKKMFVTVAVIGVLMMSAVAVYAQQGGGRGNGGQNGRGKNNAMSSEQGSNQQRGQANRAGGNNGGGLVGSLPPATADELPQDVVDLMIAGWVDEQHAYAAYESIMAQFGSIAPFANIQRAEVQHAAAWEMLFDRYDIPTPAVPTFEIPTFASVEQACALGAEAEIANFELYDEMLTAFAPYPDVYQVAQSLRDASEFGHLPAFEACAAS
jgi:hypothetical protein